MIRLIEHFNQRNLANGNITPDMLGDTYEYPLKKFNEEAPKRSKMTSMNAPSEWSPFLVRFSFRDAVPLIIGYSCGLSDI